MENNQEKKQSVGAMWKRTSAKGNKYYSINVELKHFMDENGNLPEKLDIIGMINYYKTEDKQPDYKLYKKEKREYNNDNKFGEKLETTSRELLSQIKSEEINRQVEQSDNQIPF